MLEEFTRFSARAIGMVIDAQRKFSDGPSEFGRAAADTSGILRARISRIASLLRKGRDAEAILLASVGAYGDLVCAGSLNRANFNPNEPRDDRGRWATGEQDSDDAHIEDVQYRGHFHDLVVDDILKTIEKSGAKTAKNIGVLGINGVLAVPDGVVLPRGAQKPYFLEVKTGFDPPFTPNQRQVYPMICTGYRATSFDPAIASLGLKPGTLLPPMDILLVTTAGPKMPLQFIDYCRSIGLR